MTATIRDVVGCLLLTLLFSHGSLPIDEASPRVQIGTEPIPTHAPTMTVNGVVVAPDGKPIGGASVILRLKPRFVTYTGPGNSRDVLAKTTTAADGRFAFDEIPIPLHRSLGINSLLRHEGGAELLVLADGSGIAWADVQELKPEGPVRLTLEPEAKVSGTVCDSSGKATAGVRLVVYGLTRSASTDSLFYQPGDLNVGLSEVRLDTLTDSEGRFVLHHLPVDYRMSLFINRPEYDRKNFVIDTGDHKDLKEFHFMGRDNPGLPVLRSPLAIALDPVRSCTVKVIDHAGQVVRDGSVSIWNQAIPFGDQASVNERGEVRFRLKSPGAYEITYRADPFKPRLGVKQKVEVRAGNDSPTIEVKLPDHHWIEGRVTDADTGKGLAGVYVAYNPAKEQSFGISTAVSGPDGRFRIPVAAGSGRLRIEYPLFDYQQVNRRRANDEGLAIDVPSTGKLEPQTLTMSRGLGIRGIVRDPEGKPVSGAIIQANSTTAAGSASANSNFEGRFEMSGLSTQAKSVLYVRSGAGVYHAFIEAKPNHPVGKVLWQDLDIRLRPAVTLTGKVLLKGQPRAGVLLKAFRTPSEQLVLGVALGETRTDRLGNFRMTGFEAGDRYRFDIVDTEGLVDTTPRLPGARQFIIPKGTDEMKVPDIMLNSRGQTLAGHVVDPKGNPLAAVRVEAWLATDRPLGQMIPPQRAGEAPVPPTETLTDPQGHFELRQLPDQQIQLTVYQVSPLILEPGQRARPGPIRNPSHVRPALNQMDIRVILDPGLNDRLEDMDKPPATKKPDRGK